MTKGRLTREECFEVLQEYGTPENVIAHCKAVAEVAVKVGKELNKKGYTLDIQLIEDAALLHDIARVYPHHEKVGADYLREKGFIEIAQIVAIHMHYPKFSSIESVNETDMVCLGDRVCKFDQYVGLDERMAYVLEKAKDDKVAAEIIKRKKEEVRQFIIDLENKIGCSIDSLMKGTHGKDF